MLEPRILISCCNVDNNKDKVINRWEDGMMDQDNFREEAAGWVEVAGIMLESLNS